MRSLTGLDRLTGPSPKAGCVARGRVRPGPESVSRFWLGCPVSVAGWREGAPVGEVER